MGENHLQKIQKEFKELYFTETTNTVKYYESLNKFLIDIEKNILYIETGLENNLKKLEKSKRKDPNKVVIYESFIKKRKTMLSYLSEYKQSIKYKKAEVYKKLPWYKKILINIF